MHTDYNVIEGGIVKFWLSSRCRGCDSQLLQKLFSSHDTFVASKKVEQIRVKCSEILRPFFRYIVTKFRVIIVFSWRLMSPKTEVSHKKINLKYYVINKYVNKNISF